MWHRSISNDFSAITARDILCLLLLQTRISFHFLNMECDACLTFQHIIVQREKFIIIEEREEEEKGKIANTHALLSMQWNCKNMTNKSTNAFTLVIYVLFLCRLSSFCSGEGYIAFHKKCSWYSMYEQHKQTHRKIWPNLNAFMA